MLLLSFSDISEANTIQAIPIPKNKSDVEAFLDDIFERALDTSDALINPTTGQPQSTTQTKSNNKTPKQPLQNRIKGGGTTTTSNKQTDRAFEVRSCDDLGSIVSKNAPTNTDRDSGVLSSTVAIEPLLSSSSGEIITDDPAAAAAAAQSSGLIIPNKEYEYTKMLRMFLGNKNLLNRIVEDDDKNGGEKLIYSVTKPTLNSIKKKKNSVLSRVADRSDSNSTETGFVLIFLDYYNRTIRIILIYILF